MLVINWNTCNIHPQATYIRFLLFPNLVNKENHLIPSDEIRATFVVHYHYLQGKKNHRISQKEKLKSPADTSMKMDSAIFPKNLRMVKPSKDLGNSSSDFNLNLSAPTQKKIKTGIKKQSLSSPESHSFWSICSVVFIAWKHSLWKIYKERERQLQCYCSKC